ncbi:MAG: WD40/YVTN/BNR-like repeat-containing protein [Thermomicrobiales bacterium]
MNDAVLGTTAGVFRLRGQDLEPLGLDDQRISAIYAWANPDETATILAGSYENGLFRSEDSGEQWTPISAGLTAPCIRTIVPDPLETGAILCGTEPARIFRSGDGGVTWRELDGIRAVPGVDDWYLPYSPRAGAVRNIYAPPGGSRMLASVEVGGLLDSHDRGATWTYVPVFADPDVHHITGHPQDPNLLFASLGWAGPRNQQRASDAPKLGGVARSRDGGRTWQKFHTDYTRATIVPPTRPDLVLAGPAKQVGEQGRIEASVDGGDTWQPAGEGIEMPMSDMVELFMPAPDGSIWAIRSGGAPYRAQSGEWVWNPVLPAGASVKVESVAWLPAL